MADFSNPPDINLSGKPSKVRRKRTIGQTTLQRKEEQLTPQKDVPSEQVQIRQSKVDTPPTKTTEVVIQLYVCVKI